MKFSLSTSKNRVIFDILDQIEKLLKVKLCNIIEQVRNQTRQYQSIARFICQTSSKLINIQKYFTMKSQELQIDILKRQNKQMAVKLQCYRIENQELKAKNSQLNQWVGNLSEVFATVSTSWESISILEETLLNLMKKKTDAKDRNLLRKYQFHFKTFADIINNLSDKIKNPGHSDQATKDAKQQLQSFVKNYQLIFKQLLEAYFKFNQQYVQYLTQLKSKEDVNQQVRVMLTKTLQNSQKNKQFQLYFETLKEKLKFFEQFNNYKLLDGVVKKKQQQIQLLKQRNDTLQRRIKVLFDYNSVSVDFQIQSTEKQYECNCGGTQLSYMKKAWESKLETKGQQTQGKMTQEQKNGPKSQSIQILEQKIASIEEQKQNLIIRNSLLVEKISKMTTQYKLTDQMVLKSNVYLMLKQQCQYLMDYITQLLGKLKKQQDYLYMIQKARDQQLKQVRKRYQKPRLNEDRANGNYPNPNFNNPIDIFKTQVVQINRQILNTYQELNKKFIKSDQQLKQFNQTIDLLKKANEDLNKKVADLQNKQLSKTQGLQFKYEKYNNLQSNVLALLQKDMPNLLDLWKQFIIHVKSRDKKIKDMETVIRKRDKQIAQKNQIEQMMRGSLIETQRIYIQNKQKLNKTQAFIKKTESELIHLAQENLKIQSQAEQDKNLLTLRLKAQTQARNKLEQKITIIQKIEAQFIEVKQNQNRIHKDYQIWLQNYKKAMDECKRQNLQKQIIVKTLTQQGNEKQKQLQKLQNEKQTLKSQVRQLKARVQALNATTQNQLLKMELEEYKGKIMCSCTGNRQRQVVLKTCPHLFCKRCIEDTTNNRNRKCPHCGIKFTKTDIHQIKWN